MQSIKLCNKRLQVGHTWPGQIGLKWGLSGMELRKCAQFRNIIKVNLVIFQLQLDGSDGLASVINILITLCSALLSLLNTYPNEMLKSMLSLY